MKTSTTPDGHTNWHFSRAELVALLAHASTDATRFGMCGIGLDVASGAATATDGHRAAKVWGERVNYDSAVVPTQTLVVDRQTIEAAVKVAKRDEEITITTRKEDEPVTVKIGDRVTATHLVNASHPPVDQILPKYEAKSHKGVVTGINSAYLADLDLVTYACPPVVKDLPRGKKKKTYPSLMLFPPDEPLNPWFARVSCPQNATEWAVVIMPVRL